MADTDVLKPIADKTQRIQDRLQELIRTVLSNIRPALKLLARFIKNVRTSAKVLIAKVGKAAVNTLLKAAEKLLALGPKLDKLVAQARKIAQAILATIKKAVQPEKVFKLLKSMVARLAASFRAIVGLVAQILSALNPLNAVLAVVRSFAMVLMLMLKWIRDVVGLALMIKKTQSLVSKMAKALRAELKTVTQLVKETNRLKPA
ncbi:MAG: hypothetical protein AAGJ91_16200 [Pseudomonadota bacterium]